MRNRLMIGTAALLLASATAGWAQDKTQQSAAPTTGTIEVGGRFTSSSGDKARYERYQDLRNGANVNILFNKETANWTFDLKALNVGYRDQNYVATFNSRRVKVSVLFDQTPLNYMYGARTPYNCTAGNCSLDATLRQQIQTARGTRIANGAYSPVNTTPIGVPQSTAQLTSAGSIYNSIANAFDMQSRRDTFKADATIAATDNLNLLLGYSTFKRSGQMPWGASFAFPNAVEVPLVVDNRTTDVTAALEWASHQGMMRMGYAYSKFDQKIPSLSFDNPLYATNWSGTPGTGYDANGYSSSAGGAAFGRMAMPPTNTLSTFDWLAMIKLPGHTSANASFAMGANRQDAALIPWTTNAVIANSKVYATFPGLATLPRDTADMRVNYATGTFNVNSRPSKYVTLTARYRYNSRSDFTRSFDAVEYVRFDAVPEETGGETEPFNITRNTLDLNASFTPIPFSAVRVGYTVDKWEHTIRATEGWKDNTARVSWDTVGNQYVTLRAMFEHTQRRAIDLDEAEIAAGGAQTALRFYDEASRNRNRGTFVLELNPVSMVGVNFSVAAGKDDYSGADSTQQFGLLNNKNTTYTIGVNVSPSNTVNFGADYGREKYNALQQSRTANPFSGVAGAYESWTDVNRNWTLTNDEKVNNASVYLNLVKALPKTDIRVGYDYSDSDNAFVHGGPRITAMVNNSILTAGDAKPCAAGLTSCFIALPNVTNKWQRATVDFKYTINPKVGVGFSYYYEKFDVSDWATINSAGPASLPVASLGTQTDTARIDWLGGLFTGYGNRPYKGQTGFVRLYYMF
jgi:hypothetical protein